MCALVVRRTLGERLFKWTQGVFCIYKQSEMDLETINNKLKYALAVGINEKPCREIEKIVKFDDETNQVYVTPNLADSPLATGSRYMKRDFKLDFLHPLDNDVSGVQICSVNDENGLIDRIYNMRLTKIYEIKARLGVVTENFSQSGRIIEKSTFDHVSRAKIDRLMSVIQSTYQREMYRYFGIDLKSQEAFDLASAGLLRPKDHKTPPIIYSIRCVYFNKPFFTIEVQTVNEKCIFLKELVHDIGLRLKTNAITTQIRRVRDGFVDLNLALPFTMWNYENIYDNLRKVNKLTLDNAAKINKTVLIGKTKQEELNLLNKKYTTSLVDLDNKEI